MIKSISGIVGQLTKNQNLIEVKRVFLPALLAVFIGGQIGNFLNLKLFSTKGLALIIFPLFNGIFYIFAKEL